MLYKLVSFTSTCKYDNNNLELLETMYVFIIDIPNLLKAEDGSYSNRFRKLLLVRHILSNRHTRHIVQNKGESHFTVTR